MSYLILCAVVFLATYTLNMMYVSVFYHRALCHRSLRLHPALERFVVLSGNWLTGLDPKGWVCMHRMHHEYSDTAQDPHSPVEKGIWSVFLQQLHSYQKTLIGLSVGRKKYASVVEDLQFPVSWLNRHQLWYLPYIIQAVIALAIGYFFQAWLLAACYWVGMMSHPVQGWMVNAMAHRFGYRHFETPDNSKNNYLVAFLVFGEGFQNNHHHAPQSPNFASRWWEIDFGYMLCRGLTFFGLASKQTA